MQRRTFLLGSTAVVAAAALGLKAGSALHSYDLTALLQQLMTYRGKDVQHHGVWSASEVFQHLSELTLA